MPSPPSERVEAEANVRTCAGADFAGMGTTEAAADDVDAVAAVSTLLIARTGNLGGIAVGIE